MSDQVEQVEIIDDGPEDGIEPIKGIPDPELLEDIDFDNDPDLTLEEESDLEEESGLEEESDLEEEDQELDQWELLNQRLDQLETQTLNAINKLTEAEKENSDQQVPPTQPKLKPAVNELKKKPQLSKKRQGQKRRQQLKKSRRLARVKE